MLTSPSNPRVKTIVRLRDRRERDRTGLTLVDGVREVDRARVGGVSFVEVLVSPAAAASPAASALVDALATSGVPVLSVSDVVAARVGFGDRDEGVVAVVRTPSLDLERLEPGDLHGTTPLVVVAEAVEKPGNLGAIVRSADAAGADAVVVADARTDPFNPNAIRASLGTIFGVPLASATAPEVLAWLRARAIVPVAARPDASTIYTSLDLRGPTAFILGAEATGLSDAWQASDVVTVRLPMHGLADSLNVSVAAAVLLFEARRQRSAGVGP